jgi:pentatricopeptide repeat protein
MSLGSRIAKRGRAVVFVSLASTPREPLRFLFPPWIRSLSTTSSNIDVDRDYGPSKASVQHPIPPIVAQSQTPSTVNPTSSEQRQDGNALDTSSDHPPNIEHRALSVESKSRFERQSDGVGSFLHPHHDRKVPTPIERKVHRLLSSSHRAKQAADSDRFIRHAYQTYKREETRSWLPDWRVILADLVKHTAKNEGWLEKALNIVVPESAVGQLLCGTDDNMWDIGSRYDCSIELNSRDDDREKYRSFVISGPATAISKTAADILRIAPDAELKAMTNELLPQGTKKTTTVPPVDVEGSQGGRDGSVRKVMSENRHMRLILNADKIPRPEKWTTTSFAHYVDNLIFTEMPNHINLLGYKRRRDHVTTVVQILRGLFTDPHCRNYISRTAFNKAMAYFVKTNRVGDARVLFVRMEMMKLQMDTETFNIMLRGAAKAEDLHNFHFILHLMLRRGFSPNARTWIAFMMTVPELRIKLYILSAMKEKGLLYRTSTIKDVCEQLVTQEIQTSLDQSLNQEQFLARMDSRYGPDWLTVSSGNHILHALGARGLISRCWEFLYAMEDRFIKPDNISINTILNHCKQASNLDGAIEIMKNLPPDLGYVPDEKTYHILFEIAWRARSYNLARVVWRYACLSAGTTRRMRTLVFQSLKNGAMPTDKATPRHLWNRYAGLIITGAGNVKDHPMVRFEKAIRAINSCTENLERRNVAEDEEDGSRDPCNIPSTAESTISPSSILAPNSCKSKRMNSLGINKIIRLDYTVFQSYAPSRPFADMLVEALNLDRQWKSPSTRDEVENPDCMLKRVIPVPVKFKEGAKKKTKNIMWT